MPETALRPPGELGAVRSGVVTVTGLLGALAFPDASKATTR
jgi:hypothetical protein